jgi:hypothetical protein
LLTTFEDLDGQPLVFKSIKRPFKRCLNLQARLARNEAITKKWLIKEEYDFDDFWSEGMTLNEKINKMFQIND